MGKFDNQVVIITGTSSGIGRTTAKKFAAEGAKVVGVARRAELQKSLEEEIAAAGEEFTGIVGDIMKEEDIDRVVDTAIEKYGRVDILVNNAGVMDGGRYCGFIDDENWDACIATNLTAPMKFTRRCLQYMLKQESGGRIVNVDSAAGLRGGINGAGYVSSKHGLIGLTKNVAYYYAKQGIRCNAICPGGVDTILCDQDWLDANSTPDGRAFSKHVCSMMVRRSTTDEQANVIMFLCSEEASVVNGAIIPTDSGFSAS